MINTTATNKKVREIIKMVKDGTLIPRPEFQRRLVWTSKDKDFFVDTVLRGFPFPEIYFANGEVDIETGEGTQLLVDGLQRVSTLVEYFEGNPTFAPTLAKPYKSLEPHEKSKFLEYTVVVRDLGSLTIEEIVAVFKRLNSTQYGLKDMEINNAVYNGELKRFCESIAEHPFFEEHRVFTPTDRRRMGDIGYCLTIVGSMMLGYFNRDAEHEGLLSRFNETFPQGHDIRQRLETAIDFIEECGFLPKARIWKKADLLTAIVELDLALSGDGRKLDPTKVLSNLSNFYEKVDIQATEIHALYYKAALQASNDRVNRLRRALIFSGILRERTAQEIAADLDELSLR